MPVAQKFVSSEGMSGVLNLRRSAKGGRKGEGKWKKKFAVLKQDTMHLYEGHDENGKGEDESYTIYLSKYRECTHISDKKGRKKTGFTLTPTDPTYEQWMLTCEDINQQERWISQLNGAISGNLITINFNLDDLKVQTPALHHLSKTRPKNKGRRAPSKRPQTAMSEGNGEVYSLDDMEPGLTTVDAINPAKKPRSDLTNTSPVRSPEESKASAAKAFFRGIGNKFSSALTRQRSTGLKTPQSPEPEGAHALEVSPEDRMSLSALMRTLQRIEDTSGTIVNKAAALRVLFQGAAADSTSLGRPALEVERGLQGITDTLEHLDLAEDLQTKIKEDEAQERLVKDEVARKKREEEEEAQRMQEEEEREAEEAEQRRREEEEQELRDEADRQREEERLRREAEKRKAEEEALRLAEEAGEEEERMWQSGDEEKTELEDKKEKKEGAAAPDETQDDSKAVAEMTTEENIDQDSSAVEEDQQQIPAVEKDDSKADELETQMDTATDDTTAKAVEETVESCADQQGKTAENNDGDVDEHL